MENIPLDSKINQPTTSFDSSPNNFKPLSFNPSTPDTKLRFSKNLENYGSLPRRFNLSPPYDHKEYFDITQSPDAMFPILVEDRISKMSAKFKKRASSPVQHETMESLAEEVVEENEGEKQVFKRLRIFSDEEEFNVKTTHLPKPRGRREFYDKTFHRCKSLDTNNLPLDKVQEDKNEEEINKGFERSKKTTWSMLHDLNEFNQDSKRRGSFGFSNENRYKKFSLQSASPKETIIEEQEKRVLPSLQSSLLFLGPVNPSSTNSSFNGSYHGSYHSSPRFKLKVDEIDIKEKDKKLEDDNEYEDIEMILEEAEEKHSEYQDNREFQNAMHKLQEEKEFMKKVIKGDIIGENEVILNNLNGEKEYMFMESEPIQEENEEDTKVESLQE